MTDAPDDEAESAASLFRYNPAHRWWYFPGMHAGEALLIKLHDTHHSVAWRAPHTAFRDDAADGAHPPRVGRTSHRRLLPLSACQRRGGIVDDGGMLLDENHVSFLTGHGLGRLATVAPDGTPQNKPVGYRYNADLATIDIGGFTMERSAKYRNIAANPQVAFVVDDSVGPGAEGTRFLEVRGRAEQVPADPDGGPLIRIHPSRVIGWNVPGHPGLHTAGPRPAAGPGAPG